MAPTARRKAEPKLLKGWAQIAAFLGQPIAVAQRWAKSGMPVARQGRYMTASEDDLNHWLARESGVPATRIASGNGDLAADLRQALSDARRKRGIHRVK